VLVCNSAGKGLFRQDDLKMRPMAAGCLHRSGQEIGFPESDAKFAAANFGKTGKNTLLKRRRRRKRIPGIVRHTRSENRIRTALPQPCKARLFPSEKAGTDKIPDSFHFSRFSEKPRRCRHVTDGSGFLMA
jgi:hypothetical protein